MMPPAASPGRRAARPAWTARLLTSRSRAARVGPKRRRYADCLERAIDRAGTVRPVFTAAARVSPDADGEARRALLDLAARLREPRDVNPGGLRLIHRLLTDGAGPLYYGGPGELRQAALTALRALEADATAS